MECTLLKRNRCLGKGAPNMIDGVPHFFAEASMMWEKVESLDQALAAGQDPGRALCLAC
jgi:hypothetical protein